MAFSADIKRYGGYRAFFREQSVWPVMWYRVGGKLHGLPGIMRKVLSVPYYFIFRFLETFTGISIPKEAEIGAGIRIWHFGGIFINGDAQIGENITLRQGVTIGNKAASGGSPTIGNNVDFGAYSMAIGDITIGDNVTIGAYTLVNKDVPSNSIVVGIPGKISAKSP